MKLEIKKAFNDVFTLRFFWIYLFIFTVLTTVSTIFNAAKAVPYNEVISNIFSIFTYVSIAYLITMVHNLLCDKNLNDEEQTFWQNLKESFNVGVKAFVGLAINTLIVFAVDFILLASIVVVFMVAFENVTQSTIMKNAYFITLSSIIVLISIFALLYVFKLIPITFAQDYKIKDTFKWIKTAKIFFKKGFVKNTLLILATYLFICLVLIVILFGLSFLMNLLVLTFAKTLLVNHYLLVSFLFSLSGIIIPFVGSMVHFIVSAIIYNLLSQVYKESSAIVE